MPNRGRKLNTLIPVAGVLFVLAVLLVFYLQSHYFKSESILETTHTLVAGEPLQASDLTTVTVPASAAIHGINAGYEAELIHHWSASLPIPAGSLLETTSISIDHPKGYVTVYVTPTDLPPNISPGDTIDLLVPSPTAQNAQTELPADIPVATDVTVVDIPPTSGSSTPGIEVALPPLDVSKVVAAQAQDHIAVVFTSPGQPRIPIPSYAAPVAPTPSANGTVG
ncbi:MAG: CpaB family protein [Ferrimicrobium sp.]